VARVEAEAEVEANQTAMAKVGNQDNRIFSKLLILVSLISLANKLIVKAILESSTSKTKIFTPM